MKLKGIWVAIAVICVAGIGITDYSTRHLAAGEASYAVEQPEESMESGQAFEMPVQTEAAAALKAQDVTEESEEQLLSGGAGISVQADLPDEAAAVSGESETALSKEKTPSENGNGILEQLAELDAQTEARHSASSDGSANAMKAAAESERKAWESKMQSILETLEQRLSEEEKNTFFAEQRSWVRDRESTAVANSKKQSGSALEELEYIRSLRDLTRERVYELAEHYETILDGKR